ncbi:MAG: two-component sensor histidine kinase [Austwickia sp.]|nr:two-component sensor histidine kinase [Austwickia sp.]MBK8436367.1 two-component sensor histidine kinase [Austwickia sp.]MBK9102043.1 two-component sensor histidine kinase [Austwickia sp.]
MGGLPGQRVRTLLCVGSLPVDLLVALACLITGASAGAAASAAWWRGRVRRTAPFAPDSLAGYRSEHRGAVSSSLSTALSVLRSGAVIVDSADAVVHANPSAMAMGLVRGRELVHEELSALARTVRRGADPPSLPLVLPQGAMGRGRLEVMAKGAALGNGFIVLFIEDRTRERRVEDIRRDFVANVGHELKTPVGGISLLAEAILDANNDPEAVARFARRIQNESTRLSRLVQEIVDLSRLQVSPAPSDAVLVDLGAVVAAAVEHTATLAEAHRIVLDVRRAQDLQVYGDADLLTTATSNLLTNAVNYSAEGTRVAVGLRRIGDIAEITVSDQGCGIPLAEQTRIFERFYRVDPARSRATGGTGLGLAIVKHICTNHGGEVTVWSREGQGSTFTMRLPCAQTAPDEVTELGLLPSEWQDFRQPEPKIEERKAR